VPWEFEFPFSGSLTSTFTDPLHDLLLTLSCGLLYKNLFRICFSHEDFVKTRSSTLLTINPRLTEQVKGMCEGGERACTTFKTSTTFNRAFKTSFTTLRIMT